MLFVRVAYMNLENKVIAHNKGLLTDALSQPQNPTKNES